MQDALLVLPTKILRAMASGAKALAAKGEQAVMLALFLMMTAGLMAVVALWRLLGGRV
jgi:hypothetical protein